MSKVWQRFGDYRARKQQGGALTLYQDVQLSLRNEVPIASRRWRGAPDVQYLKPLIEQAVKEAQDTQNSEALSGAKAWHWLRALVLQAPQAALAQGQMDRHPHGFSARGTRLYELIDFNDAFVSTVLALDEPLLARFSDEAKRLMDWFCKRVGVQGFSNEQYQAIVQGLSREIAVYRGVQVEGFVAQMTSRASDALGIDMVISDAASGKYVNIDCKAPSAYRHRVYDLLREGRLSAEEVTAAEMLGYIGEMNGHGGERTEVILWRIEKEHYGEITGFGFAETSELGKTIRAILDTYGTATPAHRR
ncbi:hypothetical protein IPL68_03315 [Candidatus Saccharibacteria bacterium]|nr:MAG: hypothetical protein IPL68_03315 [Candidatus Saccharibacteria bacterium]